MHGCASCGFLDRQSEHICLNLDAANAARTGNLISQLMAERQISVRSLHAQGQEAHEAVGAQQGETAAVPSGGGPAEAAQLHQPAEAAAAVQHHSHSCLRGLELVQISHIAGNVRPVCMLHRSGLGTDGHTCCAICETIST